MNDDLKLLARVFEGHATRKEVEDLVRALKNDDGLRREAARLAAVHGQLGVVMEDEIARERRFGTVMAAVREAESEEFVSAVRSRLSAARWARRAMAAAALVALAAFGIWQFGLRGKSKPVAVMATLVRIENLNWGSAAPQAEGTRLLVGGCLDFRAGLAELDMAGCGRMVVEGPAHLEFPAPGRAMLLRGRIVMRATEAGHGYRIETPRGTIIDLSTEFGVAVGTDGEVETHVLDGRVEAVADDGSRVMLNREDALRFGPSGGERIRADGGEFYTLMPPRRSEPAGFVHWPLDEDKGLLARARSEGLAGGNPDLVSHAMDQGGAPVWVDGVFGAALHFDGMGAYAESGFRGIAGGKPRTVCFWVMVPEDFSPHQGFAILSWGRYHPDRPGEVWQISANPLGKDGPVGRLRVGLHKGQVIGSTDLRDGRWHHIAVVLYGGSRPDVGTHVLLYVDGKVERVSRRALHEVRTEVAQAGHGVWLGRDVTYTDRTGDHAHGRFFRGGVDEIYIFDAALNSGEILELMKDNKAPR